MWLQRSVALAAMILLVTGCGYLGSSTHPASPAAPSQSPEPPTPDAATPFAPPPTPETTPTADPGIPTPTPLTPSSSPSDEPATGVWRQTPDFPPAEAVVTSIASHPGGFVAVGYAGGERNCETPTEGRIWTSASGIDWARADVELGDIVLGDVVSLEGTIFAFGYRGQAGCPSRRNVVVSSADGASWRIDEMRLGNNAYEGVDDITVAGDVLVAFGEAYDGQDRSLGTVWTSRDGIAWTLNPDSPENSFGFTAAVGTSNAVVVFEYGSPIRVSVDIGSTWRPASYRALYNAYGFSSAAGAETIVAVGAACCTTPNQEFGFAITSTDGIHWAESQPFGFRLIPEGVVALPSGFATIGRQSLLSADGLNWVVGPDLPGYEAAPYFLQSTGASTDEAVVMSNGRQVWVADSADLAPAAYSGEPRKPEMPEVGVAYPAEVFTHCGWPDTYFAMRAWLPDPPIDDINPPEDMDELDHGLFTLLRENELQYESSHGRIVTLRPSDEPLPASPCA